jgi:hypothetical protein
MVRAVTGLVAEEAVVVEEANDKVDEELSTLEMEDDAVDKSVDAADEADSETDEDATGLSASLRPPIIFAFWFALP